MTRQAAREPTASELVRDLLRSHCQHCGETSVFIKAGDFGNTRYVVKGKSRPWRVEVHRCKP